MYLSRVRLSALKRRHLEILSDCYEAHRLVAAACGSGRNGSRTMFRPEAPEGHIATLLVQSECEPDWSRPREALRTEIDAEVKEFEFPRFSSGTRVRFRLRANPVRTIRGGVDNEVDSTGEPKRIRVPLKRDDEQLSWLERKLHAAGALLEGALLQKEGEIVGRRKGSKKRITLYGVRFDGLLTIRDANLFQDALHAGIGPAKGFGFGLLSVSPA